jgi:hypothetical protein
MVTVQAKTIDGLDFELAPMPAWAGLETFTRVSKYLAPALDGLGAITGGSSSKDVAVAALAKAVQGLANNQPAELKAISKVLLEGCTVTIDGKKQKLLPVFDIVMQGRLLTYFKLMAWALEINYLDFYEGLKSVVSRLGLSLKGLASTHLSESSRTGPATE